MAKITHINYKPKHQNNSYEFHIFTENFNPKSEVLVFKISYRFYYPIYNFVLKCHTISIPKEEFSFESNATTSNKMVRLFCYDFMKNVNNFIATGNIVLNKNGGLAQESKSTLVKAAASNEKPWVKDLAVVSVSELNVVGVTKFSFEAQTNIGNLRAAQLLAVQWSYSINGGPKQKFMNFEKKAINAPSNRTSISFVPLPEWQNKELKVYAFFRGESEIAKSEVLIREVKENANSLTTYKPQDGSINKSLGINPIAYLDFTKRLRIGDRNKLIQEINIRLSGFGGNVPTEEFTQRTELIIKQFQRDFMRTNETGRISIGLLKSIDQFSKEFDISDKIWSELKCSCTTKGVRVSSELRKIVELNKCMGFGDWTGQNTSPESKNKYEYPGIHRSLLFGLKALQFYMSQQDLYKFDQVSSGYRCRFKNYRTTNHQGKAVDIQFSKGDWEIRGPENKNLEELRKIYTDFLKKFMNAKYNWQDGKNNFCIEPIDLKYNNKGTINMGYTYSWLHLDVREFEKTYLLDDFFCK